MQYTIKIQEAIHFAILVHEIDQKQKRKGKDIPYVTHPLTVGLILAQAGASEEVIIAGLLHDTIEDSTDSSKVTKEVLADKFGEEVAGLVDSVTEQNKSLGWVERKEIAHAHIASFSNDSVLVKSADILSNMTELLADYRREGEPTFDRFNASRAEIVGQYLSVMRALNKRWPESPLAGDLAEMEIQFARIEALGAGTLALMNWSISFIEYEMHRIYQNSSYREEILHLSKGLHEAIDAFKTNDDTEQLKAQTAEILSAFDKVVQATANDQAEFGVQILLTSHLGDFMAYKQQFLASMATRGTDVDLNENDLMLIQKVTGPIIKNGASETPPKFVIFMGGVGSGKTTIRRQQYGSGYVHFDAGEISTAVKKELKENDPKSESYITWACGTTLEKSINERRNIVIEIIGDSLAVIAPVIDKMKEIGYDVEIVPVYCGVEDAYMRHLKAVQDDPEYVSSYFTQEATLYFFYQILRLGKMSGLTA